MKKMNKKTLIILIVVFTIIIVTTIGIFGTLIGRNCKISSQVINNVNLEEKITTIFCSGKNVHLSKKALNKIKDEKLDLVINNNRYIAKLNCDNVTRNINIDIRVEKDKNQYDRHDVTINSDGIVELFVNVKSDVDKKYVSEFAADKFITNKAVVTDEGFAEVEIEEGVNEYILTYIIPTDFDLVDVVVNKDASQNLKLDIDEENYTFGSIEILCDNTDAVEIEGFRITGKVVGEYKIYAKTNNINKEANLKVEQSVEKIELSNLNLEIVKDYSKKISVRLLPENAVNTKLEWKSSDDNIATVDGDGNVKGIAVGNCEITVSTIEEPIISAKIPVEIKERTISVTQAYPPVQGEVSGITYINGIMLVNKTHPIPANYAPGLQTIAYNAFMSLRKDALAAGFDIGLLSGYRSYETQKNLYNNYVATYGQAEADTFSAKPGTSEHQTGLAMDVGWIDDGYGDTPSGKWLAENCYKYGFIIRYPKNKESITGYKYEPWHIRYLGADIAKDVYDSGLCLEEYLKVN